jgi:hypothetical protein
MSAELGQSFGGVDRLPGFHPFDALAKRVV